MFANISFGSTYTVTNKHNSDTKFADFEQYCDSKKNEEGVTIARTITVPKHMDKEIETYCANKGIVFSSPKTKEIEAIKSKIKEPNEPYIKAEINAQKLKEMINLTQCSNIPHWISTYCGNITQHNRIIKKSEELSAPILEIRPSENLAQQTSIEKFASHLEENGIEALDFNEARLSFKPEDGKSHPDYQTYAALLEAGADRIPVYMDSDTYKIANAAGLLE